MPYWDEENKLYYDGVKAVVKTRRLAYEEYLECLTDAGKMDAGLLELSDTECENELVELNPESIIERLHEATIPMFKTAFKTTVMAYIDGLTLHVWFTNPDEAAHFKVRWG